MWCRSVLRRESMYNCTVEGDTMREGPGWGMNMRAMNGNIDDISQYIVPFTIHVYNTLPYPILPFQKNRIHHTILLSIVKLMCHFKAMESLGCTIQGCSVGDSVACPGFSKGEGRGCAEQDKDVRPTKLNENMLQRHTIIICNIP